MMMADQGIADYAALPRRRGIASNLPFPADVGGEGLTHLHSVTPSAQPTS